MRRSWNLKATRTVDGGCRTPRQRCRPGSSGQLLACGSSTSAPPRAEKQPNWPRRGPISRPSIARPSGSSCLPPISPACAFTRRAWAPMPSPSTRRPLTPCSWTRRAARPAPSAAIPTWRGSSVRATSARLSSCRQICSTRRSDWRGREAPLSIAYARSNPRRAKLRSPRSCAVTQTCGAWPLPPKRLAASPSASPRLGICARCLATYGVTTRGVPAWTDFSPPGWSRQVSGTQAWSLEEGKYALAMLAKPFGAVSSLIQSLIVEVILTVSWRERLGGDHRPPSVAAPRRRVALLGESCAGHEGESGGDADCCGSFQHPISFSEGRRDYQRGRDSSIRRTETDSFRVGDATPRCHKLCTSIDWRDSTRDRRASATEWEYGAPPRRCHKTTTCPVRREPLPARGRRRRRGRSRRSFYA